MQTAHTGVKTISVIVPVYNVEPYLRRCVDSILSQTFQDFEVILVDDGSPDNCGTMCDDYAVRDDRVRVIHQQNGGISAARNSGLDAAEGEFIAFVDSDDWIHPRYLELLHLAATRFSVPMACCSFHKFYEGEVIECCLDDPPMMLKAPDEAYLNDRKTRPLAQVYRFLYHRKLLRDVRFPIGVIYEDLFFTHKAVFQCPQVAFVDAELVYYFQREGSIVHSDWNEKQMALLYGYWQLIQEFKASSYPSVLRAAVFGFIYNTGCQYAEMKKSTLSRWKKLIIGNRMRGAFYAVCICHGKRVGVSRRRFMDAWQIFDPVMYKCYDLFCGLKSNMEDKFHRNGGK